MCAIDWKKSITEKSSSKKARNKSSNKSKTKPTIPTPVSDAKVPFFIKDFKMFLDSI
jgi:hypothetical protein